MNNKNYLKIFGGRPINGIIKVSGSKNASLPIIAASLLCNEKVVLKNVPFIKDVENMLELLKYLNVDFSFNDNILIIYPQTLKTKNLNIDLMKTFRAGYYLIPILLEEYSDFSFVNVGGCDFESRPIDIHLDLFRQFGARITSIEDKYLLKINKFKKIEYTFMKKTLGGSINAILLGIKSREKTIINNYSREPEVLDFLSFLQKAGLDIEISEDSISFRLKSPLKGIEYTIMNDRIEAETFALLGLSLGRIGIFGFTKEHHSSFLSFLDNNHMVYSLNDDFLLVSKEEINQGNFIVLDSYPSLSTDMGPIIFSFLLLGKKMFLLEDKIYKTRLTKLRFFQSAIKHNENLILVNPVKICHNNYIFYGTNLREAMGYLFYCLTHKGTYYLYGLDYIKRGYEDIVNKLISLNCNVEEVNEK